MVAALDDSKNGTKMAKNEVIIFAINMVKMGRTTIGLVMGNYIKDFNFKNGKEEGTQKMWFSNGQLKANYIMKDGRRFGILGVKLCRPQNRLKRGKNSDT